MLAKNTYVSPIDVAGRLRTAVRAAAAHDSRSTEDVRSAVAEFTRTLREQGATPEAVLIAIREVLGSRIVLENGRVGTEPTEQRLREEISTWCIKEYFRGAGQSER